MIRYADLTKKVALITGSTSGIGLSTAKELARTGANICLNGFGCENSIEQIRSEIEKEFNVQCAYVNADLENRDGVLSLIEQCKEKLGPVDVLVNNVGKQHTANIEDFPDEQYHSIIELNLNSYFYTTKYCIPHMRKQNWGRIINIASVHGLVGSVCKTPYVAAKHGVVGMTKVVALEVADTDITVNTVCPGWVYTDLIKDQIKQIALNQGVTYEDAKQELVSQKQPSKTMAHPEHVGQTIAFLCSEAASSIKGTSITIDGAWTAQ